jgi:hypothetical protein
VRSEDLKRGLRLLLLSSLPLLGALAGGWLDQRNHFGFSTWRAACRSSGLRLSTLLEFTLQLLPMALAGLLAGGLALLAWGALERGRHAGLCLAAHAGCALTLPLMLLMCASALPLPMMLLADLSITGLAALLLWRLMQPIPRAAAAHP